MRDLRTELRLCRPSRWARVLFHDGHGLPHYRLRALAGHEIRTTILGASRHESAPSVAPLHFAAATAERLACLLAILSQGRRGPPRALSANQERGRLIRA